MHLIQVGVGSGGMPVLDMLSRDDRIREVTIIDPDDYAEDNVYRHLFARKEAGRKKVDIAREWLLDRRGDLQVNPLAIDITAPEHREVLEAAAKSADIGVCAADNENAKYTWDLLMRQTQTPWTLGEVLSGGIGGFVHWFRPGGPCYGCVASYLQRVDVDKTGNPDYSQPGGAIHETRIPASRAAISVIASLHAEITLGLLSDPTGYDPGFTSLLFSLRAVPDVFDVAYRPYRFRIARLANCLICGATSAAASAEDLDVALDQALARLGDE